MTVLNWNDRKHVALRVFTKYFDVTESSVCITEDTNLTLACLQMRTLLLTGRPNNRQTDQILLDLPLQIAGSSCELLIHFNVTFASANVGGSFLFFGVDLFGEIGIAVETHSCMMSTTERLWYMFYSLVFVRVVCHSSKCQSHARFRA